MPSWIRIFSQDLKYEKNRLIIDKALPLLKVLNNKKLRIRFRLFLVSEFSVENLDFWLAVEQYKNIKNIKSRRRKMREIYEEYISTEAQNQINLDHFTQNQIGIHVAKETVPGIDIFAVAQRHVFNMMETDSYARFVCPK
uniref:regulator of G-protein signaling 5-like n=1 Tax=Styela clava TaxID=7725 RepID=UPI00193A42FB|nr:regulator of G-protein signaling 5-like [Styela clava]